jgi:hypothetical protein
MIEECPHCRNVAAAHQLINLREVARFQERHHLAKFPYSIGTEQRSAEQVVAGE